MPSKSKSRWFVATLTAGLCVALLGTTCPIQLDGQDGGNGGGVTTLVSENYSFVPPLRNFNPSAAGRLITATLSGSATGSRPTVIITDATGSVVAQQLAPTTNSTTVTFTSTNNGVHALLSGDIGTGAATYTLLVTER